MNRLTGSIKHLIIINVILFAASMLMTVNLDFLALWYPENPKFGVWQIVSTMFMHGSVMHIAFNMYALWAFGTPLEQMWGSKKFLFFYFSAGIGASLIYTGVNYYEFHHIADQLISNGWTQDQFNSLFSTGSYPVNLMGDLSQDDVTQLYRIYNTPAVGASGAIYGVLVAFGFAFPDAKLAMIFLPVPIKAKFFIPLIILGDLFFGITGTQTGTAHFAHIGGALVGYIMMKYWQKNQFTRWN